MPDVVELNYPHGFYRPHVNDREHVGPAGRPACVLPRYAITAPDGHQPSTVVACFPTSPVHGAFGGTRRRWQVTARTVCGCGAVFARTRLVDRLVRDDVTVRGDHAWHARQQVRHETRQEAA